MNVQTYLFQSPYTSSVQVGRPDPSTKPDESKDTSKEEVSAEQDSVNSLSTAEDTQPEFNSSQLLDIYA